MNKVEKFVILWTYNSLIPTLITYSVAGFYFATFVSIVTTYFTVQLVRSIERWERRLKKSPTLRMLLGYDDE